MWKRRKAQLELGLLILLVGAILAAGGFVVWMTRMPGVTFSGPLAPLTAEEIGLHDNLKRHVEELAGRIGERNLFEPRALDQAAGYVERIWREQGYGVASQEYQVATRTVRNLEIELPGSSRPGEVVVVGAHYDSVMNCPGANDNGSGTAAVLELARLLRDQRLARTVRLVAFVNEEPPYFQTGNMGSLVYARRARERGEDIVAMLSVETIGYYSDVPGSQRYPFPFSLIYPREGNFVGFVGNAASRPLVRRAVRAFRDRDRFPSEGVAAPGWITGIGWSDQWAFWQAGYPALMVTDTAVFRYPHYHRRSDTPEKVDYDRLARVVAGLAQVVADLAGG